MMVVEKVVVLVDQAVAWGVAWVVVVEDQHQAAAAHRVALLSVSSLSTG